MSTLLRFDFRLGPQSSATMHELYRGALDMCEWGERTGALSVVFSEHHASDDGYLPSPVALAAAAAARTETLSINVAALLALMYDPVKLAEDMAVLDHLSGGRVSFVIGLGYRPEEFAMFGVDPARRGALMEEYLDVLRRALAGEVFEWRGRTVKVRPTPATPGGPPLVYGGGTPAAARRAGRLGMVFSPQSSDPALAAAYDEAAAAAGNPTGLCLSPPDGAPTTVFVAEDVDAAWATIGPHMLHDALQYAEWAVGIESASLSSATTVEELRAEGGAYRIVTPDRAKDLVDTYGLLALQPLSGGCPPDLAWGTLHLLESQVL